MESSCFQQPCSNRINYQCSCSGSPTFFCEKHFSDHSSIPGQHSAITVHRPLEASDQGHAADTLCILDESFGQTVAIVIWKSEEDIAHSSQQIAETRARWAATVKERVQKYESIRQVLVQMSSGPGLSNIDSSSFVRCIRTELDSAGSLSSEFLKQVLHHEGFWHIDCIESILGAASTTESVTAIELSKDAIRAMEDLNQLRASCYFIAGNIHFQHSCFEDSVNYHMKTLALLQQENASPKFIAHSQLNLANSLCACSRHVEALNYLYEAVRQAPSTAIELKGDCFNSIGYIYFRQNQFKQASEYYQQAANYYEECKNTFKQGGANDSLRKICKATRRVPEVVTYTKEAVRCFKACKAYNELGWTHVRLAKYLCAAKQKRDARESFKEALNILTRCFPEGSEDYAVTMEKLAEVAGKINLKVEANRLRSLSEDTDQDIS